VTDEKRISTPLVLAATSGMLVTAVLVYMSATGEEPEPEPEPGPLALHIDDSTPEAVAESFYDAWRRRRWPEAERLSMDEARAAVVQKRIGDESMQHDERIVAERGWDALAQAPLTMEMEQVDIEEGDRYSLRAVAAYEFVGQPYRRRVVLHVRGTAEGFRVTRMDLGEVLTELPPMFRGGGAP